MTIRTWWERTWFEPEAALNLAVARLLAAGTGIWVLLSRDRAHVSGLDASFWAAVPPAVRWRYLLFPGHAGLEHALVLIAALLLLGALAGIGARWCCLGAGLLLYHLAPL